METAVVFWRGEIFLSAPHVLLIPDISHDLMLSSAVVSQTDQQPPKMIIAVATGSFCEYASSPELRKKHLDVMQV